MGCSHHIHSVPLVLVGLMEHSNAISDPKMKDLNEMLLCSLRRGYYNQASFPYWDWWGHGSSKELAKLDQLLSRTLSGQEIVKDMAGGALPTKGSEAQGNLSKPLMLGEK
ncbi:PREDICTED: noggin-like [Galeopterus variegatus]|uniref:Noggin-like n=1 Tax=Galeopterus variegatus TaxID=482537 RepID=A0ABM0QFZ6_GALVR|nr:PREDICTED: noggin-like [Galeopterus variegatus]